MGSPPSFLDLPNPNLPIRREHMDSVCQIGTASEFGNPSGAEPGKKSYAAMKKIEKIL